MLFLENMTNSFEATNFMLRLKVHNCYLWKILFDLQHVQINLIKSLYNREKKITTCETQDRIKHQLVATS